MKAGWGRPPGLLLITLLFGLTACGGGGHTDPTVKFTLEGIEILAERLRSTAGGCEIAVTFRNVSDSSGLVGFTYDVFDGNGQKLGSLSTAVISTPPGETRTVSSEGTTAGPSGIPCSQIARFQLRSGGRLVVESHLYHERQRLALILVKASALAFLLLTLSFAHADLGLTGTVV